MSLTGYRRFPKYILDVGCETTRMGLDGQVRLWIGVFVCRDMGKHENTSRKGTNDIGWTHTRMENTSAKQDKKHYGIGGRETQKCINKIKTHTPKKSIPES